MQIAFTHVVLLPALAVPIALSLGLRTWQKRSLPGATPFVYITGLAVIWSTLNALQLAAVDLQAKLLLQRLQFVPASLITVTWLIMALDYTGKLSQLARGWLLGLFVLPVATIVLAATDPFHHLVISTAWLLPEGSYKVLGFAGGFWFWVYLGYSYLVSLTAEFLLLGSARRLPARHRGQPLMLFAGFAIPLMWNAIHFAFPSVPPHHDFTSAILGIGGIIVTWGLLRFRLFNLVPIARDALVENMSDGLLVLDEEHRVVDLNEAARKLIDLPASGILAQPISEIWSAWPQLAAPHSAGAKKTAISLGDEGSRGDFEVQFSRLSVRGRSLGSLLVLRDVTERSLLEQSLRRQALTDGLTGLPNRTMFMAKLDDAVRQARRTQPLTFAVVALDLDRFKLINDSIGHLAGDYLLENIATKLKGCLREVDTVARMGGDEFMVLIHGVTHPPDVIPVVERIQTDLGVPLHLNQQEITSSASIGVAIWDDAFEGPEGLLRAADTAMYQAKEAGGSCYRIFDEKMHEEVLRALRAETELRSAIQREEFVLEYQPIVDLKSGAVCSLEALIRWRHAEQGTLLPSEFIKIAESSGLIVPLGALVLEEVCSQLSHWRAPGYPVAGFPVSLNVSPRQLTETDFVPAMLACMDEWKVGAESIILEVTETALISDPLKSKQAMLELREAGIALCLDDFGVGFSSLHHLTTFPVQHLKLDRSFVSKIAPENTEFEIVRSITDLAHSIGLKVTGEGVEHEDQLRLLTQVGCDQAQGFLLGRPMPPDVLSSYLGAPHGSLSWAKTDPRALDGEWVPGSGRLVLE